MHTTFWLENFNHFGNPVKMNLRQLQQEDVDKNELTQHRVQWFLR
jgi:hypothetical protein